MIILAFIDDLLYNNLPASIIAENSKYSFFLDIDSWEDLRGFGLHVFEELGIDILVTSQLWEAKSKDKSTRMLFYHNSKNNQINKYNYHNVFIFTYGWSWISLISYQTGLTNVNLSLDSNTLLNPLLFLKNNFVNVERIWIWTLIDVRQFHRSHTCKNFFACVIRDNVVYVLPRRDKG